MIIKTNEKLTIFRQQKEQKIPSLFTPLLDEVLDWDLEKGLLESGTFTALLFFYIDLLLIFLYLFRQQLLQAHFLMCYITKLLTLIRTI